MPTPQTTDHPLAALEYLVQQFDEEPSWGVRASARSYTWWPHDLAQRFWADPPDEHGNGKVHIVTDIAKGIAAFEGIHAALGLLNAQVTTSAMLWDERTGVLTYRSSLFVSPATVEPLKRMGTVIAGMQALEALLLGERLASAFKGVRAVSEHPLKGARSELDPTVVYTARFLDDCTEQTFVDSDFMALFDQLRERFFGFCDPAGFTVELPFFCDEPALLSSMKGRGTETALLRVAADEHPRHGPGVLVRLTLPVIPNAWLSHLFNDEDATTEAPTAFIGAWAQVDTDGLNLVGFVPAALRASGLLTVVVSAIVYRTQWARGMLEALRVRGRAQ